MGIRIDLAMTSHQSPCTSKQASLSRFPHLPVVHYASITIIIIPFFHFDFESAIYTGSTAILIKSRHADRHSREWANQFSPPAPNSIRIQSCVTNESYSRPTCNLRTKSRRNIQLPPDWAHFLSPTISFDSPAFLPPSSRSRPRSRRRRSILR
jgi:hypothetical protein